MQAEHFLLKDEDVKYQTMGPCSIVECQKGNGIVGDVKYQAIGPPWYSVGNRMLPEDFLLNGPCCNAMGHPEICCYAMQFNAIHCYRMHFKDFSLYTLLLLGSLHQWMRLGRGSQYNKLCRWTRFLFRWAKLTIVFPIWAEQSKSNKVACSIKEKSIVPSSLPH